jgi:hypothetical protein
MTDFFLSQIIDLATGPAIITIDKSHLQQTILQYRRVLMDQFEHKMPIRDFVQQYFQYYAKQCNLEEFRKDLANVVQVRINLVVKIFSYNFNTPNFQKEFIIIRTFI